MAAMPSVEHSPLPDYYALLGINEYADSAGIKRAFREKAKLLHPDIAGPDAEDAMRLLIAAYETLLDGDRRYAYDRARSRIYKAYSFDYRAFLREEHENPVLQARLVFYELLRGRGENALLVWREQGALLWKMRRYMDREDWMDSTFLLAEELFDRACYEEAAILLEEVLQAEEEKPYFRHFALDVKTALHKARRAIGYAG
jgi:curved DNA-binding protein CbpA